MGGPLSKQNTTKIFYFPGFFLYPSLRKMKRQTEKWHIPPCPCGCCDNCKKNWKEKTWFSCYWICSKYALKKQGDCYSNKIRVSVRKVKFSKMFSLLSKHLQTNKWQTQTFICYWLTSIYRQQTEPWYSHLVHLYHVSPQPPLNLVKTMHVLFKAYHLHILHQTTLKVASQQLPWALWDCADDTFICENLDCKDPL